MTQSPVSGSGPALGKKLPDLTAQATSGRSLRLSDFRGAPLIVYFYPKDNTSGCTVESQNFRDLYPKLQALGAELIGVSRDSLKSHEGFKSKQALPFDLVSDPDESWCRAFDVIREKKLYGRAYLGVDRSTFLIDASGKLRREWRGVKVPGHATAVLAAVAEL